MHHHVVPPQFADDSMPIRLPDTEAQLRSMDNWHIRTAITSLTPRVILKNLHRLRRVARICNEFQAQKIAGSSPRFGAFALLPFPDVDGALEEITYALDIFHLDGVGLFSSVTIDTWEIHCSIPSSTSLTGEGNCFYSSDSLPSGRSTLVSRAAFRCRVCVRHHPGDRQPRVYRHSETLSRLFASSWLTAAVQFHFSPKGWR